MAKGKEAEEEEEFYDLRLGRVARHQGNQPANQPGQEDVKPHPVPNPEPLPLLRMSLLHI